MISNGDGHFSPRQGISELTSYNELRSPSDSINYGDTPIKIESGHAIIKTGMY
jgi:hypothetical protein